MASKTKCCMCKTSSQDVLNLGEIKTFESVTAHYYCLLLASTIRQSGEDEEGILGFLPTDIEAELALSKNRLCVYCNKKGATVLCNARNCKVAFHLPCGVQNKSGHQFFGRFLSYCKSHRQRQKFTEPKEDHCCPICYDNINFNRWSDILWAPCCKKNSFFHKRCIQQMALSAGYFFKCPVCNNKEVFQKTMKQFGVFIPDRDASWELVPNAFQELLYRHEECNVEPCVCSRGKNHSSVGPWTIVLCDTCGSQGTHMSCSKLKKGQVWQCSICNPPEQSEQATPVVPKSKPSSTACSSEVSVSQTSSFDCSPSSSQPSTSGGTSVCAVSPIRFQSIAKSNSRARKRKRSSVEKEAVTVKDKPESTTLKVLNAVDTINIEDTDDSDVVVVTDDDEPNYKCLIAQDGSILKVRNISEHDQKFSIQGDLEIKEKAKPPEDSFMKLVITDVRSVIDDEEVQSKPKSTANRLIATEHKSYSQKYSSESLSNEFVLYNGNQNQVTCTAVDQNKQLYIVQEVLYNRITVHQNRTSADYQGKDVGSYSNSSDNDIVIID